MSTGLSRGNSQNKQFIENVASKYNIIAFVDVSANYPNDGTLAAVADGQQYAIDSGFSSINANWGVITNGQDKAIIQYVALKSQWEVVFTPSASEQGTLLYDKSSDTINSFNGTDWSVASGSGGSLSTYYSETVESLNGSEFSCFDGGVIGAGTAITTFAGIDTTNPLNDKKSLTFTIPATGTGKYALLNAAKQIAVPLYAQSKRQLLTFESRFDGNTGDISLFLWDATNSAAIKDSTGATLYINPSNGVNSNKLWFETSATANLQWGVIINNTNTGKILTLDNLQIDGSPDKEVSVYASSEWKSFTPTGAWAGTYTGMYRRVGDSMEIKVYFSSSGSQTGDLTINMPNGFSIDTSKEIARDVGTANFVEAGTREYVGSARIFGSANTFKFFHTEASGAGNVNATSPFTWDSGDELGMRVVVPILGWSDKEDNVVVSGTKATYAYVECAGNGGGTLPAGQDIPFITVDDTKGLWNGTQFTADRDMIVEVSGQNATLTSYSDTVSYKINGTFKRKIGSYQDTPYECLFNAIIKLKDGDILSFSADSDHDMQPLATVHHLTIKELPNYEDLILAYLDESVVAAKVSLSSAVGIQNGAWSQVNSFIEDFPSKSIIFGGSNNSTLTIEKTSLYKVSARISFSSNANGFRGVRIRKNGLDTGIGDLIGANGASGVTVVSCSDIVQLNKGDIISTEVYQTSGSTLNLASFTDIASSFSIHRIR